MPLPRSLQLTPRLGAFRDADPGLGAVERPNVELAAERGLHHRDRHPAIEVGAVALEERMRLDGQENIEVARRAAAHSRFALAGQANARAVLDAGRDIDRERALSRHAAGAGAFVAWVLDGLRRGHGRRGRCARWRKSPAARARVRVRRRSCRSRASNRRARLSLRRLRMRSRSACGSRRSCRETPLRA